VVRISLAHIPVLWMSFAIYYISIYDAICIVFQDYINKLFITSIFHCFESFTCTSNYIYVATYCYVTLETADSPWINVVSATDLVGRVSEVILQYLMQQFYNATCVHIMHVCISCKWHCL
jgi:hypothetical protein